jgi:hypothetical protein
MLMFFFASFSQADVRPFAQDILMALFTNIERGQTPEKMAENDYLMRCKPRLPLHLHRLFRLFRTLAC